MYPILTPNPRPTKRKAGATLGNLYLNISTKSSILHMAVFEDLPNEIINEIISCLCNLSYKGSHRSVNSPQHPQNLLNIGRVSRLLRIFSEPFLYRSVTIGDWDYIKRKNKQTPWPFLRTILSRPNLATHVKTLNIKLSDRSNNLGLDPTRQNSIEVGLFVDASKKLGLPLSINVQEDQIVLLLYLLPGLQSFGVSPLYSDLCRLLRRTDKTTTELVLKGLRHFLQLCSSTRQVTEISSLNYIFSLPCISSIEAYRVDGRRPRFNLGLQGSSVTELKFVDSDIHGDDLAVIFRHTKRLTHFEYEDAGGRVGSSSGSSLSALMNALEIVRPSLKHLKLNLELASDVYGGAPIIGSLKKFPVLSSVHCGFDTLVGSGRLVDVLPATIKELTLHLPFLSLKRANNVVELLGEKDMKFQELKVIKLIQRRFNRGHGIMAAGITISNRMEKTLRVKSKETGVSVVVLQRA